MADNNITKLLKALLSPFNDVEDAFQQLLTERSIDTAIGAQLDLLGKIVGQARSGTDDVTYRRYIRARILVSRSHGLMRDVYAVARAIIGQTSPEVLQIENQGVAALVLLMYGTVPEAGVPSVLQTMLRQTVAAGVRIIEEIAQDVDANTFFTAVFAAMSGAHSIGNTTVTVVSTSGFPDTGSLDIDLGLAVSETVTYTGRTATTFTGVSALAHNHVSQSAVTLNGSPGKGLGDSSNSATGGRFASAQD